MWKVTAHKELRETLWLAALALAAYAYVVGSCTGIPFVPEVLSLSRYALPAAIMPFINDEFFSNFVLISAALAIGVGMRQSAGESRHGTWLFLRHLPVEQWKLTAVKLAVGVAVCLGTMALPILIYGWWAATPGTHPSPFEWSMTEDSWQAWFSMTPGYLGAFLIGVRPGRWFGSGLLPFIGAGLVTYAIQLVPCWWILGVLAILALDAWLVASILYVAHNRDY